MLILVWAPTIHFCDYTPTAYLWNYYSLTHWIVAQIFYAYM